MSCWLPCLTTTRSPQRARYGKSGCHSKYFHSTSITLSNKNEGMIIFWINVSILAKGPSHTVLFWSPVMIPAFLTANGIKSKNRLIQVLRDLLVTCKAAQILHHIHPIWMRGAVSGGLSLNHHDTTLALIRVHLNDHQQHVNMLNHFIYIQYRCGMWETIHSGLQPQP